jgi:2-hydroxy-6-oxonona-2,4-dienedioate hydrolase
LPAELTRVWTKVGAYTIFSRHSPDAATSTRPAVVLVHGLGTSSLYMVPTAVRLAEDFHVYALDLPGFGHSSKPSHALAVPALADVLAAWMAAIGLERVPMVGNSFGCQVIAEFGLRYADRLDRAVLQGPTIDGHARTAIRQFSRFLLDLPRERVPEYFINAHDYWRTGLHRGWETFQIALKDRIERKVSRLAMPVLLVRGQHDPIVSQRWVKDLTALLPNGRSVVTRGAHTPNFSEPDAFTDVVRAFLRRSQA